MPELLNDINIQKILGSVIINADESCIHPNSYMIRLGQYGEFLNSKRFFELGEDKYGIIIRPGDLVAVSSFETIDFSRDAVHKHFPGVDLYGVLVPILDLSRSGLILSPMQIDAGFKGTLNWTICNFSQDECSLLFKERILRLNIFTLNSGELPSNTYDGEYQNMYGYVGIKRKGPPVSIKDSEWERSSINENQRMEEAEMKNDDEDIYDIFLSYSSRDYLLADEIYEKIIKAGGKAFLAKKSIEAGTQFDEEIRRALINSNEVWLLVSPNSIKSEWVISEWGAAWALEKRIIPILYQCSIEALPDRLKGIQCIDFHEHSRLIKDRFSVFGKSI